MTKHYFLIMLAVLLNSCAHTDNTVTFTGEIKALGIDTLYLYGMDEMYDRIDTIPVVNGHFTHTITVDTLVAAFLLFDKEVEYPIFFTRGDNIKIKAEQDKLSPIKISGNIYNEEYHNFLNSIQESDMQDSIIIQNTKEFITAHPSSPVSLYLLDKYLALAAEPDYSEIKNLIKSMNGVLQDKSYSTKMNDIISQEEKNAINRNAPVFNLTDTQGEKITRNSDEYKKKVVLLVFWASWADSIASKRANNEIKAIYNKYKNNEYFVLLGVSLDLDKERWLKAIENDTLEWKQVADLSGMSAEVVDQYAVKRVPWNVLIGSEGRIAAKNIWGQELTDKVDEQISRAKARAMRKKKK